MKNSSIRRRPVVLGIAAIACAWSMCAAQQTQPSKSINDTPKSPAAALNSLLALLTEEGEQFSEDGTLSRAHPSIASEFPHELPEAQLALKLTKRQHRDPLVDAYVRWQLTSFNPTLPDLRSNQVQQLLDDMPALAVNPRADDDLIRMMNRALEAGQLSETDQEKINDILQAMGENVSARRTLNTPALEFRQWFEEQHEDNLRMRILLSLERCHALVSAGWPMGGYAADTERLFMKSARNRYFTDDDRRIVSRAADRIVGTTRVYVQSARIVESRLEVNFADTGIYDFDIRRWLRRMDGR